MPLFKKDADEAAASNVDELVKKAPSVPEEVMQALQAIDQELEIFQTRVATVMSNYETSAPKSVIKKSMSHAKHASMCVRDALKAFGRLSL